MDAIGRTADTDDREGVLLDAVVELADSLAGDFDVVEMAEGLAATCVRMLAVDSAAIVLADPEGRLKVMASTTAAVRDLERRQSERGEGPGVDAYRNAVPVYVDDLRETDGRWSRFVDDAQSHGYRAVYSFPLCLGEATIGSMNLFRTAPGPVPPVDLRAGRAFAHAAAVAVLRHRALRESHRLVAQLESALTSRIVIEQAKGRLLERGRLHSTDVAFARLRAYARRTNQRLSDVAEAIMNNSIDTAPLLGTGPLQPSAESGARGRGQSGRSERTTC